MQGAAKIWSNPGNASRRHRSTSALHKTSSSSYGFGEFGVVFRAIRAPFNPRPAPSCETERDAGIESKRKKKREDGVKSPARPGGRRDWRGTWRNITNLRQSLVRFPGVALPIVADRTRSRPRRRWSSLRAREVACRRRRAHGLWAGARGLRGATQPSQPHASDDEGVGESDDRTTATHAPRTDGRSAGRSVDRSDAVDRWSTRRCDDDGPVTRAAYERYFPACLMSSSAAPLLLLLLVVKWLCSWTVEGRRT